MGLLILIATGAAIGWLATVINDVRSPQRTTNKVLAGICGALIVGVPVNQAPILVGLSPAALLLGAFGSFIAILAYRYLHKAQTG